MRSIPRRTINQSVSPRSWIGRVVAYYELLTERSYLANWSPENLALHLGIDGPSHDESHEDRLANTNRVMAEALQLQRGERVLDAGCGVGGTCIWMAQQIGVQTTGITIVPKQVKLAKQFASQRGVSEATEFLRMDFHDPRLPPSSYDAAYHIESLCHAVDFGRCFGSMFELLKSGGRYGCLDFFATDLTTSHTLRAMREGWVIKNLAHWNQITDELESRGFSNVAKKDMTARVKISALEMKAMAVARLKLLAETGRLKDRSDSAYAAHAQAGVSCATALAGGELVYGLVCATKT